MVEMEDMETMEPETAAPPPDDNNDIHIEIDSKSYKLTIYIEFTSLVIMLEPEDNNPEEILQNSFNIAELKNLHKSLKASENLEEARDMLLEIFTNEPKVQKIENGVTLNINYAKKPLSITLKKMEISALKCLESIQMIKRGGNAQDVGTNGRQ